MKEHGRPLPTRSRAPTKAEVVALYRRAFAQYGARTLWNIKEFEDPTVEQVLAITRQLRTEGDMRARASRSGSKRLPVLRRMLEHLRKLRL
jgi:hypothetical protein